jgi:hypothetical protein
MFKINVAASKYKRSLLDCINFLKCLTHQKLATKKKEKKKKKKKGGFKSEGFKD